MSHNTQSYQTHPPALGHGTHQHQPYHAHPCAPAPQYQHHAAQQYRQSPYSLNHLNMLQQQHQHYHRQLHCYQQPPQHYQPQQQQPDRMQLVTYHHQHHHDIPHYKYHEVPQEQLSQPTTPTTPQELSQSQEQERNAKPAKKEVPRCEKKVAPVDDDTTDGDDSDSQEHEEGAEEARDDSSKPRPVFPALPAHAVMNSHATHGLPQAPQHYQQYQTQHPPQPYGANSDFSAMPPPSIPNTKEPSIEVYTADYRNVLLLPHERVHQLPSQQYQITRLVLCSNYSGTHTCFKGPACRFVHADLRNFDMTSEALHVHINYVYTALAECTYERQSREEGVCTETIQVAAPNNRGSSMLIPANLMLKTRGAALALQGRGQCTHCAHYFCEWIGIVTSLHFASVRRSMTCFAWLSLSLLLFVLAGCSFSEKEEKFENVQKTNIHFSL